MHHMSLDEPVRFEPRVRETSSAPNSWGLPHHNFLVPLHQVIYGSLLEACRRAGRLGLALQLANKLKAEKLGVNVVHVTNLMDAHGLSGE